MSEVENILLALDLSPHSKKISEWTNVIGSKFNVPVHVLHVVPTMEYWGFPYTVPPERMDDEERLVKEAEIQLEEFCRENLNAGIFLTTKVVVGHPAEEIISYINTNNISLVLVGTHGKSGLNRAIFGSVTDRVLRFSPVPVMCINPHPKHKE